jgi:hypothetical protein
MPTEKELHAFHARQNAVMKAKLPKDLERQALAAITQEFLGVVEKGMPANRSWQAATMRTKRQADYVKPNSKAELARSASDAVLREAGNPVPLYKLTDAIEARGVHLGGTHPSRRLSAILGASPKFISTREGWTTADAAKAPQKESDKKPKIVGAAGTTYIDLAIRALTAAKRPLATPEIIAFMRQYRPLPDPLDRKTIVNITSAFSHDERM